MNAPALGVSGANMAYPLPVNVEAEQAVLGAILMNNDAYARVSPFLDPMHFTEPFHRTAYEVIGKLIDDGTAATPVTLKTYLGEHELVPGGITVPQYLARLAVEATTVINCETYGQMIVDIYARREMMTLASDLQSVAANIPPGSKPSELIDHVSEQLHTLREHTNYRDDTVTNLATMGELLERAYLVRSGEQVVGMKSGLVDLDYRLGGGLQEGRLYVVAGRPGAGKTVLAIAMAHGLMMNGTGVGIFSLEIDRRETMARFAACEMARKTPTDYRDILLGSDLSDAQIEAMRDVADVLRPLPFEVDTTPGLTMAQIEAKTKRMAARMERKGQRLGVVIIDYLQLLKLTSRYEGNMVAELGEAVMMAKNMAKRLGVAVILLSQLNRSVESRENKRPSMADLRGSGNIEEHADVVALLHRPAYYDRNDPTCQMGGDNYHAAQDRLFDLNVIVDKNRLGEPGTTVLYCNVGRCSVQNHARSQQ